MPTPKAFSVAAYYDRSLVYAHGTPLPEGAPRPLPTSHWPPENIQMLERYRTWLIEGGNSELVVNTYHLTMAGHVVRISGKSQKIIEIKCPPIIT